MLVSKALLTVGGAAPGGVLFRSQNGATVNTTTSYTVTVPQGVTSIAALAIGAGGGGGGASSGATAAAGGAGGGALSYSNSIAVTPGETLTVNVPNQSDNGGLTGTAGAAGRDASILRGATTLLLAQGGRGSNGTTGGTAGTGAAGGAAASGVGDVKQSGGTGGNGTAANDVGGGGGGAAGYSGTGGAGGTNAGSGNAGTGGGGGGGGTFSNSIISGPGGGVLWYGQGANGAGGLNNAGNATGSLGSSIGGRTSVSDVTYAANSSNMIGLPGSGGAGAPSAGSTAYYGGQGAGGAVRILWNKTFDWAAPLNVTSNTITIPEYTTSATADIVTPQVQLGDTLYFVDYAMGATLPAAVAPSGFTILGTSQTSGTTRLTVYTRQVLSYTESGVTLTGATGSTIMSKFLIVVRGTAGAARSDWQSVLGGTGSSTSVQSAASFTYTQTGTVGISTTTTTIDAYAMGVPVCFLFFGSGTGADINPDTDMTMTGATTLLGPSAKTCMKVLCFDQSTTSLSVTASTADLGSTNTSSFWFQQFY
jgi:hypothetical protein